MFVRMLEGEEKGQVVEISVYAGKRLILDGKAEDPNATPPPKQPIKPPDKPVEVKDKTEKKDGPKLDSK